MGIDGLDLDLMLSRRCEEFSAIHLTSLHSWLVQIHQQRYFLKNGPKVMITNPLDRQKFNIPYLTHPQYECPKKNKDGQFCSRCNPMPCGSCSRAQLSSVSCSFWGSSGSPKSKFSKKVPFRSLGELVRTHAPGMGIRSWWVMNRRCGEGLCRL